LKRFTFGKDKRLTREKDFKAVLSHNLRVSNKLFTLYITENDYGHPRLGISVSRFCGNAVVRNRLKRLLREAFRQSQDQIPADFDYLLIISPSSLLACDSLRGASRKDSLTGLQRKMLCPIKTKKPTQLKGIIKQLLFEQIKTSFLSLALKAVGKVK
jgi:ribonuclease P protein component